MESFRVLKATAAAILMANIDTDAIIPAVWLRAPDESRGRGLFARWRYREDGQERPEFILNRPEYRKSGILVAGSNFGCGSSREDAVWALSSFGIRCVIASSFSDIFAENALKNGLLLVVLPEPLVRRLGEEVLQHSGAEMTVDLERCEVIAPTGWATAFSIDAHAREILLSGTDEISQTLAHENAIAAFQAADRAERPWIYQTVT